MPADETFEFDGHTFAKAWCSTALAAGTDPEQIQLYRATLVEVYSQGILLCAMDGLIFLRTWVPFDVNEEALPPTIDEAPTWTVVLLDRDARAANLCTWVLRETSKKDPRPMHVELQVLHPVEDEEAPAFEGLVRRQVRIEVPGSERVDLGVYEGVWLTWRELVGRFTGEETPAIALNPEVLDRLVKLGRIHGSPLVWTFGGHDRMSLLDLRDSKPWVSGCVMPMRLTPEELELALGQGDVPSEADLVSSLLDSVVDTVNGGALDSDGLTVTASSV